MAFVERIRPGHVERLLEQHRVCLLVREAVEQRPGLFDPCSMESKLRSCPQKMKDLGLKTSRDKHLP